MKYSYPNEEVRQMCNSILADAKSEFKDYYLCIRPDYEDNRVGALTVFNVKDEDYIQFRDRLRKIIDKYWDEMDDLDFDVVLSIYDPDNTHRLFPNQEYKTQGYYQ